MAVATLSPPITRQRLADAQRAFIASDLMTAERTYRQILHEEPDQPQALHYLGLVAYAAGHHAPALDLMERSFEHDEVKSSARCWINRGSVLKENGRVAEAMDAFHTAGEMGLAADAYNGCGVAYSGIGEHDLALANFRASLDADPNFSQAHENLLFALDQHQDTTLESALAERLIFDKRHCRPLTKRASAKRHANDPDPDRPLRVGYVGADFRMHSAARSFAAVLFKHDPAQVRWAVYSGNRYDDDLSARLKSHAGLWRDVCGWPDERLARQIRDDEIDILVDLAGYSRGSRLMVFARKPAPINVTAWGYATGVGISAMDAYFTDAICVPPELEHGYRERVIRLPVAIPFVATKTDVTGGPLPALLNGYLTFGYLGRTSKCTPRTYDVWAKILHAVPGSRLLIKSLQSEGAEVQDRITAQFTDRGIAARRIEVRGGTDHQTHLEVHREIDLSLDPIPTNGGITTLESLWMGVPVLSLLGRRQPERLTAALQTHAFNAEELDWLIAETDDGYLGRAVALSNKLDWLSETRATLRDRLLETPMLQHKRYTEAVEAAYRDLWRTWCQKKAA